MKYSDFQENPVRFIYSDLKYEKSVYKPCPGCLEDGEDSNLLHHGYFFKLGNKPNSVDIDVCYQCEACDEEIIVPKCTITFFEEDGKQYHHVSSLYPIEHNEFEELLRFALLKLKHPDILSAFEGTISY